MITANKQTSKAKKAKKTVQFINAHSKMGVSKIKFKK